MKQHIHHELFEAAARGEADQFEAQHRTWIVFDCTVSNLTSIYYNPSYWTVRRKVKPHIVNGWKVPAPMTEAPKVGDYYWVESADVVDWCCPIYWTNSKTDKVRLSHGSCHVTKQGAAMNCKARYGVDPFAEGDEA